ncbi:MAG: hypothetical protein LWX54_03035, partial [Deltaproteobacteria bacterium]|nr:hypothetical protein [Deltaproteobacteria bacterium]
GSGTDFGYQYRARLFQYLILNGYCIISPAMTNTQYSDRYYSNGNRKDERSDLWGIWPGPDAAFLRQLIDDMYDGHRFNLNNKNNNKLNMNKLVLGGYSSGAQFASRCYNEWPVLTSFKGRKFPKIRAGWLLAGASYRCYDTLPNPPKDQNKCGWTNAVKNIKDPNFPNIYPKYAPTRKFYINKIGCCPDTQVEDRYDSGNVNWNNHPPIIITEPDNDMDADPQGSLTYYNHMRSKIKDKNKVTIIRPHWNSERCNIKYIGTKESFSNRPRGARYRDLLSTSQYLSLVPLSKHQYPPIPSYAPPTSLYQCNIDGTCTLGGKQSLADCVASCKPKHPPSPPPDINPTYYPPNDGKEYHPTMSTDGRCNYPHQAIHDLSNSKYLCGNLCNPHTYIPESILPIVTFFNIYTQ